MKVSTHYFVRVTLATVIIGSAIGLCVAVFFVNSLNLPAEHIAVFLSKIINETRDAQGIPNLAVLNQLRAGLFLEELSVSVVDENLKCVACENPAVKFPSLPAFTRPYEVHTIPGVQNFATRTAAVKLPGVPSLYVMLVLKRPSSAERIVLPLAIASTILLTLLSGLIGTGLIVLYTRKRGREALRVIEALKSGNLQARFPTTKLDEVGLLMTKFNDMAAEVERLVGRLRQAESGRRKLLQELSHDIRTPLTGARSAATTLAKHYQVLSEEERIRCAAIVQQEVEYTQRIVDDLFLLAALDEPQYRAEFQTIDVIELLKDQYEKRAILIQQGNMNLQLIWRNHAQQPWPINGVRENLIRLFRNALDNAQRFAVSKIIVIVTETPDELCLVVQNDGARVSAERVAEFGKQRLPTPEGKAQRGLGSVIMRAVAEQHLGKVDLSNWTSEDGSGAQTVVRFPRALRKAATVVKQAA